MIFNKYKGYYLEYDEKTSLWYAIDLHNHKYTDIYETVDKLREAIHNHTCQWISLSELTAIKIAYSKTSA